MPLPISKTLTASTIVGNFTCLEVVFKFKRRLGWVGGAKDFSDCTHFSFQVLSVSHLCSHLLDRHHVLDIILDQARGESFEHTHQVDIQEVVNYSKIVFHFMSPGRYSMN